MMSDDPAVIHYTVKELLAQLKSEMSSGLSRIEDKIGDVSGRIDRLESRVGSLENASRQQRSFIAGLSKPVLIAGGLIAWAAPMAVAFLTR